MRLFLLIVLLVSSAVNCTHTEVSSKGETSAPPQWSSQMQKLANTLSQLLPYSMDPAKFNDQNNYIKIRDLIQDFSSLASTLHSKSRMKIAPADADPSLQFVGERFSEELAMAQEAYQGGHKEYARKAIKNVSVFCVQCHTRSDLGPQFPSLALKIDLDQFSRYDKAEFLAATRQFDAALETYMSILSEPEVPHGQPFAWTDSARRSLSIAMRVKQDPKIAMKIVNEIIARKKENSFLYKDALQWKIAINDWLKETPGRFSSAAEQLEMAETLIKKAKKVQQYPADGAADAIYLRATAYLHNLLQRQALEDSSRAKAFYLIGEAYSVLRDLSLWSLHETYYEACIREVPHTLLAMKCYQRFEESLYEGYTGSSGTWLPIQLVKRLETLKALARTEAKTY